MISQYSRTELLIGSDGLEKLKNSRVAVFGVGGVGGFTVEALARSGVGTIDIIDNDTVSLTNINRQIIATHSTVGKLKVDVMEERIKDISPSTVVNKYDCFFLPENAENFDFRRFDYVVDAIDTVSGKIGLAEKCKEYNVKLISSMGAGNKLDPTAFEVTDIFKTSMDPLARVMRGALKKRGIKSLWKVKKLQIKELSQVQSLSFQVWWDLLLPVKLLRILQVLTDKKQQMNIL